MATDSSVAGYLAPTASPDYDALLNLSFHDLLVGVTGINGKLVRPRWTSEPINQPAFDVDWVAFGVTGGKVDTFAKVEHDPTGDGSSSVKRDETLELLFSFYGPNASSLCARLKDGLELDQNRATLAAEGIAVIEMQEPLNVPALMQQKWVKRVDVRGRFRRRTERVYAILSVESAEIELNNDLYVTPINITP